MGPIKPDLALGMEDNCPKMQQEQENHSQTNTGIRATGEIPEIL